MDERTPPTHWIDGRIVDDDALPYSHGRSDSPWQRVIAVLLLLLALDLALSAAPPATSDDGQQHTRAELRASLQAAAGAAAEGRRSLLLVGDSVLAGDVMAGRLAPGQDWQHERVLDHARRELSPDSDAALNQVALDGLLPVDAAHVLTELDRIDPAGEVELVLEINLRYFSWAYARQLDCTRPWLCDLGAMVLSEAVPIQPEAGALVRALVGVVETATWARDVIAEYTPIHRHRQTLAQGGLVDIEGLAIARAPTADAEHTTSTTSTRATEGLARVQEHYRRSSLGAEHVQVQAFAALLDRLAANGRRATLFLTPLDDAFVRSTLPANNLGRRYDHLASIVNGHVAGRRGHVQLIDLDHPLFAPSFLDHVHLDAAGNRVLAINLLHELGLPLAQRPAAPLMAHGEDHDRTLIHRRGTGYADGGAWEALLRSPGGVAVSRDGSWVVIADTGNHALRQLRGNMQFLERLAGMPMSAGDNDGLAIGGAHLHAPRSLEILGQRVVFVDGPSSERVRVLADGYVHTLTWDGPACARIDMLEAGVLAGREWLYLLCHDDRILGLDIAARRSIVLVDPRAPLLADEQSGATREFSCIEPSDDGRLFFADGDARIWVTQLRDNGHSRAPVRVFDNLASEDLPNEFERVYPFGFDEVHLQRIVGMEWVERYGMLLIQDQHAVNGTHERLHRQLTERVHLRLLDFESQQILPWIKAIPHGDAHTMWNAKTGNLVSYFHLGEMAIAADDASLIWAERKRSRVLRLADGLLGVEKSGNLHTTWSKIVRLNTIGSQTSRWVGARLRPDRYLDTRHDPIAHHGPYVALMVNSSLSAISDRIGNYSLGRVLENELQAELGYRDKLRLDLFQRTVGGALQHELDMFADVLDGSGPPPDLLFIELHDARGRFLRDLEHPAARRQALDRLAANARRHDTLVIFYDLTAMDADGRDGLRATTPALRELIGELRQLGFVVLEPSDRLLRELLHDSPWGNQTWGPGRHHGAPWAVELGAQVLAQMSAPLIRDHLRGRTPARLREHARGATP